MKIPHAAGSTRTKNGVDGTRPLRPVLGESMKPVAEIDRKFDVATHHAASAVSVDPVCGMTVEPKTAAGSHEYKGQTYYFCSLHCLNKFRQDPESFIKEPIKTPAIEPPQTEPTKLSQPGYTCPMHPEVKREGPGSCPKCGMALEPVMVSAPKEKIEYTCPMHPQIVRDTPGNCPICGMALEPRTVSLAEEENEELKDMRHRFWVSAVLTVPALVIGMSDLIPGAPLQRVIPPSASAWLQLVIASPVILWGGWPFFVRFWQSLLHRSPKIGRASCRERG